MYSLTPMEPPDDLNIHVFGPGEETRVPAETREHANSAQKGLVLVLL